MSITDYASLKTAVATRSNRSDLTLLIPDFVRAAHDVIVAKLMVCADLSLSTADTALPSDYRSLGPVIVLSKPASILQRVDTDGLSNLGTDCPRYYNVSGSTLTVAPTPDITYAARVLYKLARTAFSADADTNTALTRYPLLYLNGAMAELYAHTRNGEERDRYLSLFLNGIEAANAAETEDFYGDAALQPVPSMVV
jgi:hypothetical protein